MKVIVHTPVGSYWSEDEYSEDELDVAKEMVAEALRGERDCFILNRVDQNGTRQMFFGRETLLNSVIEFVDPQ